MGKRAKRTPEERAADKARYDEQMRRLREAIERRRRASGRRVDPS
jgi:GH18 family chitinase